MTSQSTVVLYYGQSRRGLRISEIGADKQNGGSADESLFLAGDRHPHNASFRLHIARGKQQELIKQGAQPISDEELVALAQGNSSVGDGWVVFWAPDGWKAARLRNGTVVQRNWRVEKKQFCDTMVRDASEVCGVTWLKDGERYTVFGPDGGSASFRLENCNVASL